MTEILRQTDSKQTLFSTYNHGVTGPRWHTYSLYGPYEAPIGQPAS